MSQFRYALGDIRGARTWTERLYFASPLAEAALKSVWNLTGASARKAADANNAMAANISIVNKRALAALGEDSSDHVQVRSGPFAGMSYFKQSTGSVLGPKLVGTYESEIHEWIGQAIERAYEQIIDVGCAEGYYAVGLARACSEARVFAYDLDANSQTKTKALAHLNGVSDRIVVGGLCQPSELGQLLSDRRALVIVDIEGAENELLDPEATPELRHADLIIETHEKFRPGVLWRLLNRFVGSHVIDIASAQTDQAKVAAAIASGMDGTLAEAAVPEYRALPQLWLRLTAR